jgi:hypothetical protein
MLAKFMMMFAGEKRRIRRQLDSMEEVGNLLV